MCKNKYNLYEITTTYLNGDVESIDFGEKDARNYKQILELYKETKQVYADENTCVKINFCGVTQDNKINILFSKEITNIEDKIIKQKADELKEKSVADITNTIIENLNMLIEKDRKLNETLNVLNKKQDVELHRVEAIKYPTDAYKLQVFDNIANIRNERRITKNELTLIGVVNIKEMKNQLLRTKKAEHTIVKTENKIIENGLETYVFVKEIKYRNFKEAEKLLVDMKIKYDKVSNDDSKMLISVYNNNGKTHHKKCSKSNPVVVKSL